jgi:nucleoside-diphosphate-sugar epimerase
MSERPWIVSVDEPVLVTGSNGFIGSRVVRTLLDHGFRHVRCFVRPSSNLGALEQPASSKRPIDPAIQMIEGNLLSRDDCARATAGVSVIFHLAAGMDSSFAGCFMNSVLTTRNLLEMAASGSALKRFVNVSSFAVYSNVAMPRHSLLDEQAALESEPNRRQDPYGYGKLKQEQLVQKYGKERGVPYVILRPGAVFGPGKPGLTGRIGINTFGPFLHMGGSNELPLTYVDNCADAIVLAGLVAGIDGEIFNVVDDDLPTSRDFLRLYKAQARRFVSFPMPYPLSYLLCALWEDYSLRTAGQLPARFNRRRCAAEWKGNRYSNRKLKELAGWTPRVPFEQACRQYFEYVRARA